MSAPAAARLVFGEVVPCPACNLAGTVPGELVGKPEPGARRKGEQVRCARCQGRGVLTAGGGQVRLG